MPGSTSCRLSPCAARLLHHLTQRPTLLIVLFTCVQLLQSCMGASLGNSALCPFDVVTDHDPSRVPHEIKHHTCRKSVVMNAYDDDTSVSVADEADSDTVTCYKIGGQCVQDNEYIKVWYKNHSEHHHVKFMVKMSCVCRMLRTNPAMPVLPDLSR